MGREGRLWVSETVDYPNQMQEPGAGHDQIVIVENPTGQPADVKTTVLRTIWYSHQHLLRQRRRDRCPAPDILFFKRMQ